jgi:hypothetical protein
MKQVFTKELLVFKHYQVDIKEIKHLLQQWREHEIVFLNVGFLVC